MKRNILAPSILAADFCILGHQIQLTEKSGAEYLHFDVMDGVFVPSVSFGALILQSIQKITHQVIDVHLMVREPIHCIDDFAKAGADIITIHLEACEDVQKTIDKIKSYGVKCGISIKPATEIETLLPYLSQVDMVLLMSVEPGKGGQPFIQETYEKIHTLKQIIEENNLEIDIELDGGINADNLSKILEAGVNIAVAGSAVFNGDISANTKKMMGIMKGYEEESSHN